MILKKIVFEKVSMEDMYKEKMNGFDDESLVNYSFLSASSLYKTTLQNNAVQKEYLDAYMKGAEILLNDYNKSIQKGNVIIKMLIPMTPLSIPIIYICRHCVELAIKFAIYQLENKQITSHNLSNLWKILLKSLDVSPVEQEVINDMGKFVSYIEKLDDKSTKLRYPLGNDNNSNQGTPLFVNCDVIVKSTKRFVNQIYNINYDKNSI